MPEKEKLEVGNNTIDADGEFADGYYNGNSYYYDTNRQLPSPLTSEAICSFIMENLFDQQETIQWNTGFVLGWIASLCENNPTLFYTSIIIPDETIIAQLLPTVLQEAEK